MNNVGSSDLYISDRTDYFDGALFDTKGNLGIMIPHGSSQNIVTRFCSANSFQHDTRTDFSGTDALNNRITYTGPDVTLSAK